jgi:PEP-CTERM motif-containing protein
MANISTFRRWLMVAVPLAFAAPAWASIGACPAGPATAPADALTAYQPPSSSSGCFVGNIQFSNFVVGTDAGDTINGLVLGANTVAVPGTDAILLTAATEGASIELSPNPANAPKGTGFCGASSGSSGWCIQGANQNLASDVTYQMVATSGTISIINILASVDVHASGSGSTLGASSLVFLEVCPGVVVFAQGCAGYQVLQVGLFNAKFQNLVEGGSVSFSPTTQAAVRETVYMFTHNGTGSFADIDFFDTFTPEPATFGLVGFALAGLGALRFRKRKV